ncbi:hypothetical protein LSCM1_00877 [Leishmania martiniquensis]|uniref:Uncharacterized protein n=1 Tax=Leishmania martiniquensis TaxID=1580590 RepID=A0A836GXN8_9TRYP|nr:hypothetical protein LSCM1_00877 [Leishmania martiniquensis]
MSGTARRDAAGGELTEEEEEEELGLPSSSPRATSVEACSRSDRVACNGKNVLSRTPSDFAMRNFRTADTEDEFALDISFVASKVSSSHSGLGAFAPAGLTTTNAAIGLHQRRMPRTTAAGQSSTCGQGQEERQLSIIGTWEKVESVSLSKYQGSDILDDSDRQHDEAEFRAWKMRDAFRRQQLLL